MNKQEKQIIDLYYQYKSVTKVAALLKVCRHRAVKPILVKYNIPVINHQNKPKFNIDFFEEINTEEKAYWLGFLYADGNVSNRDNTISIGLQLSDYTHLIKLKSSIESKLDVKLDYNRSRCRFRFANSKTKSDLNGHGLVPRKSHVLKFPDTVPYLFIRHFIRGYFDGDGCIGIYKYDKNQIVRINCIGTRDMLSNILAFSMIQSNLHKANSRGSDDVLHFQLSGEKAYRFLTFVYSDSSVFLDRKFNKYLFAVQSLKGLYDNCGIKQGGCDIVDCYKVCKQCDRILSKSLFYREHAKCKHCVSLNNTAS